MGRNQGNKCRREDIFQETYILKKVGEGRLRNKVQCKRKDHEEKKKPERKRRKEKKQYSAEKYCRQK